MLSIKGHYIAKSIVAKIDANFAIKLYRIHKGQKLVEYWDLNAFRPDLRDDQKLIELLRKKDGLPITILYEKVKYTDTSSKIPRFIIYDNDGQLSYFVNVR